MKNMIKPLFSSGSRSWWLILIFGMMIFAGVLPSCQKNNLNFSKMTQPEWSPTWTLPLIHSDLTLHDILKKGNNIFIEDPVTHMLTLEYAAKLFSQSAQQYLQIPNQWDIKIETTIETDVSPGDSSVFTISAPYSFTPAQPGQRLDTIFIKSALIDIDVISQINHRIKVDFSIPNAMKNGKTFDTLMDLQYQGTLPVRKSFQLDFSGYRLIFLNTEGHINELTVEAIVKVFGDENPNNSPYPFTITADITNIEPTPKSPIKWILSEVEGCKHLLLRTLRLRSVSGFPLNCLFGADSILNFPNCSVIWANMNTH